MNTEGDFVPSGESTPSNASPNAKGISMKAPGTAKSSFSQRREDHGNGFQITLPWSPQVYFTVRGAENLHICLWILKDLAWTQKWYVMSWVFGLCAIAWSFVLVYHAFTDRNYNEMYMLTALIMWLAANFLWMAGEVFHDDDSFVVPKSAAMMEAAMAWMMFYYLFLKPLKLLPVDPSLTVKYCDVDLIPRFSFFSNWREYEHAHTFFWCGKDLMWNVDFMPLWVVFLFFTFFIGLDFVWTTYKSKRMMIDCAHYVAQLIWVIGNAVWAMGEVFEIPGGVDDDKGPYSVWHPTKVASHRCRWWSSVVLVIAFAPIIALYLVWLPLTCMGMVKAAELPENEKFGRPSMEEHQDEEQGKTHNPLDKRIEP